MSSMQVDNRERGFAYAYDAPLDMRMDPDQELTAYEIVNTWDRRRLARTLREYGEERFADRIAGEIVRRRGRAGARPRPSSSTRRSPPRSPRPPASPAATRPSARSRRSGSPSTASSHQLDEALPLALGRARRSAAASPRSPSTRSRTGASSASSSSRPAAASARPTCPICVCGNTPEAELVHRRSIVPTPGEIAANPRSKSARLRAARKLREER